MPFRSSQILGDVEFADDTVTCSPAAHAPAVEALFDSTLGDWDKSATWGRPNAF